MNQKKAGVLLSYLSEGIKILSSLLYTPIMLRLLGQSEYGLYQLVHSVVSYLSLFSLGFTSSYLRYFSIFKAGKNQEDIWRLNGMFMTIFLVLGSIAALCGVVMIHNIHGIFGGGLSEEEYSIAKILMSLMIFNLALTFPNSVFNCIVSAHEQFFFQRLLTVLQNILNPFLTLPLLLMGYGSIGMVVITTLITIAKCIANMVFVFSRLHVKFVFHDFEFDLLKDIGGFTFFLFVNQVIDQINWSVDRFLLGRMVGTTAVAIYGLGAQINTMYVQLSTTVSSVFAPKINRMVVEENNNHDLSNLFTRVGRIQFILLSLVMSGFIFLGRPFMRFWGGKGYEESYFVALWLIIPVTVPLIQNIGIEIQRAKNKHRARSIVYFLIAIGNIFLSIPLIRLKGATGAAIGTAVALILGNIIFMNWYYSKKLGLEIYTFWKSITSFWRAFLIPEILGICIMKFVKINNIWILIIMILLYASVFCVSMWEFGMSMSEKKLVTDMIKKVKKDD